MKRLASRLAILVTGALMPIAAAHAADLKVYSTVGVQTALQQLTPALEKLSGAKLEITWGTAAMLVKRIEAGESADVLILTREGVDTLGKEGKIAPGTALTFASAGIAVAVKAGAPKPEIATADQFKAALLAAKTIGYVDPASGGAAGVYLARLMERLGIADQVKDKTRHPPHGGNAADLLVSGEAELVLSLKPELMAVSGIEVVGPLPADLNSIAYFSAGVGAGSTQASAAKAVVDGLNAPDAQAVLKAKGLDPG